MDDDLVQKSKPPDSLRIFNMGTTIELTWGEKRISQIGLVQGG